MAHHRGITPTLAATQLLTQQAGISSDDVYELLWEKHPEEFNILGSNGMTEVMVIIEEIAASYGIGAAEKALEAVIAASNQTSPNYGELSF